jgi:5-methylcytosine-specific restriction protein A
MPERALRPCSKPGCPVLTASRFCSAHVGEPKRMAKAYDADRATDPIRRLYGTRRWRRTSLYILARDPICIECGREPSTLADHYVPAGEYVAQNNGDTEYFFDYDNLQGLGKACHAKKTAREQARGCGGRPPEAPQPATDVQPFSRVSRSQKLEPFCNATA